MKSHSNKHQAFISCQLTVQIRISKRNKFERKEEKGRYHHLPKYVPSCYVVATDILFKEHFEI